MSPLKWSLIAAGIVVLLVVGLVLVSTVAAKVAGSLPQSTPSAPTQPQSAAKLTAAAVVDKLSDLYPLPNPTDNTGSCAAKPGDKGKGCLALITTDAVSVYEFEDAAAAKRWVAEFVKIKQDWRQAGRFALAWSAREQALTSKEARSKMIAALKKWVTEAS